MFCVTGLISYVSLFKFIAVHVVIIKRNCQQHNSSYVFTVASNTSYVLYKIVFSKTLAAFEGRGEKERGTGTGGVGREKSRPNGRGGGHGAKNEGEEGGGMETKEGNGGGERYGEGRGGGRGGRRGKEAGSGGKGEGRAEITEFLDPESNSSYVFTVAS